MMTRDYLRASRRRLKVFDKKSKSKCLFCFFIVIHYYQKWHSVAMQKCAYTKKQQDTSNNNNPTTPILSLPLLSLEQLSKYDQMMKTWCCMRMLCACMCVCAPALSLLMVMAMAQKATERVEQDLNRQWLQHFHSVHMTIDQRINASGNIEPGLLINANKFKPLDVASGSAEQKFLMRKFLCFCWASTALKLCLLIRKFIYLVVLSDDNRITVVCRGILGPSRAIYHKYVLKLRLQCWILTFSCRLFRERSWR